MRRANHFTCFALLAALGTTCMAGFKFYLTRLGEMEIARNTLKNDGATLANSVKLQIEGDLRALSSVANLWSMDSNISRSKFRDYVTSVHFQDSLEVMTSVILLHRVKDHQRELYETDPGSVIVRHACCSGNFYDFQGQECSEAAAEQCNVEGDRFHIIDLNRTTKTKGLAPTANEYLPVTYQEPLENNPGPMGFNMLSHPVRKAAWEEARDTGGNVLTPRVKRIYARRAEFGMLLWCPLFVNEAVDGDKSPYEGVSMKALVEWEAQGVIPYAIGSVAGIYLLQHFFYNVLNRVFGKELRNTRAYLFDARQSVPANKALLAVYDQLFTHDELFGEAMAEEALSIADIQARTDHVQVHIFNIQTTTTQLAVVLEPTEDYFSSRTSHWPFTVLLMSIATVVLSQLERWLGHPAILSSEEVMRAKFESVYRRQLEEHIVEEASKRAQALLKAEQDVGTRGAMGFVVFDDNRSEAASNPDNVRNIS